MNAKDFRRLALQLEGKALEEGLGHMGAADFRVGGRIFATLAHQAKGYGNLMLTPAQQALFVEDQPNVFLPVAGGWGRNGATHVRLGAANEDLLAGALAHGLEIKTREERKNPKDCGRLKAGKEKALDKIGHRRKRRCPMFRTRVHGTKAR